MQNSMHVRKNSMMMTIVIVAATAAAVVVHKDETMHCAAMHMVVWWIKRIDFLIASETEMGSIWFDDINTLEDECVNVWFDRMKEKD